MKKHIRILSWIASILVLISCFPLSVMATEKPKTCTLTLYIDNKFWKTKEVTYGEAIDFYELNDESENDGFYGHLDISWYVDPECTELYDSFDEQLCINTPVVSNLTLYGIESFPVWEYVVNSNGIAKGQGQIGGCTWGKRFNRIGWFEAYYDPSYDEWYIDSRLTTKLNDAPDSYFEGYHFVLYRRYESGAYNIIYESPSGNWMDNIIQEFSNETEEKAILSNTFTKDGYYFAGWNTSEYGDGNYYDEGEIVSGFGPTSLYPTWIENGVNPDFISGRDCSWNKFEGKFFWYEGGYKQGTYDDPQGVLGDGTVRGREIYDAKSNGWYWLDSVYGGAKAVGKEVWMPYIYQDEASWSEDFIRNIANESDPGMGECVLNAMLNHTGKWVRYDENGAMLKGWVTIEGALAQLYPTQSGNVYYYDHRTGLMARGNVTIDGVNHYFDEITGVMQW